MYLPDHFREDRAEEAHRLIVERPLGTLVTCGADGLTANEIPFILDPTAGPFGVLQGHVARANAVWREELTAPEVLVIFRGSEAYITPNWYPAKAEHHRVVPTWNYLIVHAHGPLVIHDDVRWIRAQAGRLTKQMERAQATPWKMADAPRDYTDQRLTEIVGIEIPITRLIGKAKLNQNRSDADRLGVVDGLRAAGEPPGGVADLVERALNEDLARRQS
jgi:transcriptional regulator